jgi:predicted MFS family arabinose efflux permease
VFEIPAFLLDALRFRETRREVLREVTDHQWKTVLSGWSTARLAIALRQDRHDDLPDWVRSRIDAYLSDTALRFDRIKATYSTVAKALRDANADYLVIKGFSLWPGYTVHPRFRPQGDIDLYCPPESILRARDTLLALGYTPNLEREHFPKDHLCTMMPKTSWEPGENLFDPDMPICFELHFCWWNDSIMRFCPTGLDQFWTRRVSQRLEDISFPGLNSADNLAYTALNILRDRLLGVPAAEQVYGLARFLHLHANDHHFWATWRNLHDESLRRLEIISFRMAAESFACSLPEQVQEEIDSSAAGVEAWFREFSKPPLSARFDRRKDGVWLHTNFVDSVRDKASVVFRGLLSIPVAMPTFASVEGPDRQSPQDTPQPGPLRTLGFCRKVIKYAGWRWLMRRGVARLMQLPFFLWRGLRYGLSTKGLSPQFWTFLAASFCFDLGMAIFFFLYNLYLLDCGFKEEFLGAMTSAMGVGSIACTIPAGILIERLGLRKSLLFCFALVPFLSAARVFFSAKAVLLAFAFLSGFVTTVWAVALSPAITRLTNEKSRPLAFSIVFSFGIGIGSVANLIASRMPGWFAHLRPLTSIVQAKQFALLVGCSIVALGILPVSRLAFPSTPVTTRKLYPRNRFLLRFLPALALWTLVTGSLSPLANVYFSRYLQMPLQRIGEVFSFASLFQALAVLMAPFLFRKLGLVSAIAGTQLATALLLACLAATSAATSVSFIYVGYSGLLWMSEPGLFSLLMKHVTPAEQAGASALNFLVISLTQAIAVAATGASFARFGYPRVLYAMAGVALVAALFFRFLLGETVLPPSEPSLVGASSEERVG